MATLLVAEHGPFIILTLAMPGFGCKHCCKLAQCTEALLMFFSFQAFALIWCVANSAALCPANSSALQSCDAQVVATLFWLLCCFAVASTVALLWSVEADALEADANSDLQLANAHGRCHSCLFCAASAV